MVKRSTGLSNTSQDAAEQLFQQEDDRYQGSTDNPDHWSSDYIPPTTPKKPGRFSIKNIIKSAVQYRKDNA